MRRILWCISALICATVTLVTVHNYWDAIYKALNDYSNSSSQIVEDIKMVQKKISESENRLTSDASSVTRLDCFLIREFGNNKTCTPKNSGESLNIEINKQNLEIKYWSEKIKNIEKKFGDFWPNIFSSVLSFINRNKSIVLKNARESIPNQ